MAAGFVYLAVLLAVGLAAGGRPNNLLVWVFGFLLAGLLVSGMVSGFSMMALRIVRSEPREQRQLLAAHEDVHRVDLHRTQSREHVRDISIGRATRSTKALCGTGQSTRLGNAE